MTNTETASTFVPDGSKNVAETFMVADELLTSTSKGPYVKFVQFALAAMAGSTNKCGASNMNIQKNVVSFLFI
jgi:hypothetical protein